MEMGDILRRWRKPKPSLFLPDGWQHTSQEFLADKALGRSEIIYFPMPPEHVDAVLADGLFVKKNTLLVSIQGEFLDPRAVIAWRVAPNA